MTDIQEIYSILLSRGFQEELFSKLPGDHKKQKKGQETLVDCPFCHREGKFSYNSYKPVWRCWSCGKVGDWISYLDQVSGYTFKDSLAYLAKEAGVEIAPQLQSTYQTYTKKADLLEVAQEIFINNFVFENSSDPVRAYLLERGYSLEDIKGMELGAHTDRAQLEKKLKEEGFSETEIKDSGLLTKGFGEDYQLTLLWRDQAGRAIGVVGRALLAEEELKAKNISKYKYSYGLQKDQGLIGFSSVRGSSQVILVEGVLDALYLNYRGFKSVAVGGTSLSDTQIKALENVGVKELLLSMDRDNAGQTATEKIIKTLSDSRIRPYIISLPEGYKDPDELIRKLGSEAFQEALNKAESWPKWLARRIVSRYDLQTDRGLDQALEEALEVYTGLDDKLKAKAFMDSLKNSTGLQEEDLADRLQELSEKASGQRSKIILDNIVKNIQEKASTGDILGAQLELSSGLRDLRSSKGVQAPEPYLVGDLTEDILLTSPALVSGYESLDRVAKIPVGALTIIAGRPGHGKTTLQLNLLVNLLRAYPDKKFYFFSYEEAKKALAIKLLMILSGETLDQESNYGAYINYLKEKRGSNKKIEEALIEYEELTSSGRLLISDNMYPAEDLVAVIDSLARVEDTGAVIIDYIQKIPLLRPSLGQRYLDIKLVSSLLLDQAVQLDIPIILGAQLGRGDKSSGSKVKLDNLRESGDIEQDANLVLGLYTKAVEDIEKEDYQDNAVRDPEVDMELTVLKNRAGVAGKSLTLSFDRPVYRITKKKTFGANSKGKTY